MWKNFLGGEEVRCLSVIALLKGWGSRQIHNSPFGYSTITKPFTQSVGADTAIKPKMPDRLNEETLSANTAIQNVFGTKHAH